MKFLILSYFWPPPSPEKLVFELLKWLYLKNGSSLIDSWQICFQRFDISWKKNPYCFLSLYIYRHRAVNSERIFISVVICYVLKKTPVLSYFLKLAEFQIPDNVNALFCSVEWSYYINMLTERVKIIWKPPIYSPVLSLFKRHRSSASSYFAAEQLQQAFWNFFDFLVCIAREHVKKWHKRNTKGFNLIEHIKNFSPFNFVPINLLQRKMRRKACRKSVEIALKKRGKSVKKVSANSIYIKSVEKVWFLTNTLSMLTRERVLFCPPATMAYRRQHKFI